jgi:hypothetical protein
MKFKTKRKLKKIARKVLNFFLNPLNNRELNQIKRYIKKISRKIRKDKSVYPFLYVTDWMMKGYRKSNSKDIILIK